MEQPLDKFGKFIIQNLHDKIIHDVDMLLAGKWKAPALQDLQNRASGFSEEQKQIVRDLVAHAAVTGMHDFLFALQESSDSEGGINMMVDGKDIAKLSDGLHGEIFGDSGWTVHHSKYPKKG